MKPELLTLLVYLAFAFLYMTNYRSLIHGD